MSQDTALPSPRRSAIARGGTPLPNERRTSERMAQHDDDDARRSPCERVLFFRPLRQAPRLDPHSSPRCGARALASRQDRQSQAQACDRSHARSPRRSRRLSHRHHAGLRHRRGRNGALVAARRARRRCSRLGELRRRLGHRRRQGAQAQGRAHAESALWRVAGSRRSQLRPRRRLHLERHDVGRSRSRRELDPARPQGPDDLRCDLRRLRARARLAEARCCDLLLAEGPGRRGGARGDHFEPAGGGAASRPIRPRGQCRRSSASPKAAS